MNLATIARRLPREAIGPALSARIRGRSDVEHLRRLTGIASGCTDDDVAAALAWCDTELLSICYEDWGPPPWRAPHPRLTEGDEILRLRVALRAMAPCAATEAPPEPQEPAGGPIPAPDGLAYLPFQVAGIRWALAHQHALIADDPGTGKTIQAAGAINALEPAGRIVVVCPASLRINWTRELTAWLVTPRTIEVSQADDLPDCQVVIIGYSTVDRHVAALVERGIDLLILDECHAIKSATASRTKACTALIRASKRGVYLSGTPMLNRPVELEPLLKAVGSPIAEGYQRRYCAAKMKDVYVKGGGKRRVWDATGASNLDELSQRLRETIMIRRRKADVLTELPAKRRRTLALDGGSDELLARGAAALTEIDLEAYVSGSRPGPMAASEIALIRHEEALAKLPAAMDYAHELLTEEEIPKLVIFGYHRDVLEKIVESLKDFNPVLLYGGMSDAVKQDAVDRFQQNPLNRVFVGSIQAAGVGITLTAASRALFVESDWVPAIVTQAEDRIHRKGQVDSVLIEHLVLPGGIDDRLARAVMAKQAILDRTLDPVQV